MEKTVVFLFIFLMTGCSEENESENSFIKNNEIYDTYKEIDDELNGANSNIDSLSNEIKKGLGELDNIEKANYDSTIDKTKKVDTIIMIYEEH